MEEVRLNRTNQKGIVGSLREKASAAAVEVLGATRPQMAPAWHPALSSTLSLGPA
jgi:hypothetical protein